jgi:DNA-binding transcriptional regulator YiaG
MSGPEFLAAIEALGLTREAFAARFGLHRSAVYRWGRERPVPPWVPPVLAMIEKDRPA